jgi:hypothetical protein
MSYSNEQYQKRVLSIDEQKIAVEKGLKSSLTLGAIWKCISIIWFNKWKEYVNYDEKGDDTREEGLIESLHPGPLDNKCLLGNFGDELSRHVIEGNDFILLPENVSNVLEVSFPKCENEFGRKVVNFGKVSLTNYQVELYPTRCEFYEVTEKILEPDLTSKPFLLTYFRRTDTLYMKLCNTAEFANKEFRIWMKTTPRVYPKSDEAMNNNNNDTDVNNNNNIKITSNENDKSLIDDDYDNISMSSISPENTPKGRKFTTNITDVDGDWKLLRNIKAANIPALLGGKDYCIDLTIFI